MHIAPIVGKIVIGLMLAKSVVGLAALGAIAVHRKKTVRKD